MEHQENPLPACAKCGAPMHRMQARCLTCGAAPAQPTALAPDPQPALSAAALAPGARPVADE